MFLFEIYSYRWNHVQYIIICSNKLEIEKMNNLFAIGVDIKINSQWNLWKLLILDN